MAFQFLCSIKIEKYLINDSATNHKASVAVNLSNSAQMSAWLTFKKRATRTLARSLRMHQGQVQHIFPVTGFNGFEIAFQGRHFLFQPPMSSSDTTLGFVDFSAPLS
jgi:hypothetical protein